MPIHPPPFDYRLIRRRGQKSIRLKISRTGEVVVSAPASMDERALNKALEAKKSWVEKHLAEHRRGADHLDPRKRLYWNGNPYRVIGGQIKTRGRFKLIFDEESLSCSIINQPGTDKETTVKTAAYLKKMARGLLKARLDEASQRTGIDYQTFYLRDQKTLWGSSSGKGNISLNWRCAMLPPALQEYLICHELIHQRHFNHSPAYWAELERVYPGAKEANKTLKDWKILMNTFR